jgi:hypothetical protein
MVAELQVAVGDDGFGQAGQVELASFGSSSSAAMPLAMYWGK